MAIRIVQDVLAQPGKSGQLIVANTYGRLYATWHSREEALVDECDQLAQRALLEAWWERPEEWYRVGADPCAECGHYRPLCALCLDDVSVFPDAEWMKYTVYLCAWCGDYSEDVEVGIYSCCDGCGCDE